MYLMYSKVTAILFTMSVISRPSLAMFLHTKCRGGVYPRSDILRATVPDEGVPWTNTLENYNPAIHTASSACGKPWSDPDIGSTNFTPNWNNIDRKVNRASYVGKYIIENGYPLNPMGRTGIRGRGVLGRWGPNHAADPVVTQWKKIGNSAKVLHEQTKKPILQFIAIQRGDSGEWALPGGMVDPGEKVTAAAIREFQEEATNSLIMNEEDKAAWKNKFDKFFSEGDEVYRGYVDDPRNTDNAWMETVAYNFHDETGTTVGNIKLHAGDDAVGVRWVDIDSSLKLYASHRDIIKAVATKLNSHW